LASDFNATGPTMPDQPHDQGLPGGQTAPESDHDGPDALPRPIQEHIGRQLRSAYNADAQRPAYLGDPAVPPQFERLIRRIELGEKVHELGVAAVADALRPDALADGTPPTKADG
jgi:hypothetical protein